MSPRTGATGEGQRLEPAEPADAAEVAALIRASKAAAMPWLPVVHSPDDDLGWVTVVLLVEDEVVVAREGVTITGVLATRPGWIDQLYVLPAAQGRGVGRALLERAKAHSNGHLELWAFTRNSRARRFYESAGFQVVEDTDGASNEEREPDVRYRWVQPPARKPGPTPPVTATLT